MKQPKTLKDAIKLISEANKTINKQDAIIGKLTRRVEYLEDTETKRQYWLSVAKKDAGYPDGISFDRVWAETLAKAKSSFNVVASGSTPTRTSSIKKKRGYTSWE